MINFTRLTHFIDTKSNQLFMGAAGLSLAFFLSFVVVLAQASTSLAQSSNTTSDTAPATKALSPVCGGTNLIDQYKTTDPEKFAKIQLEAGKIIFGKNTFWKVEKQGLPPSYLLGTMHMADERIAKLEGAKAEAFDQSETVIIENIEALDPVKAQVAMLENKAMTFYTDGTTLSERLDEETIKLLKKAAENRAMPFPIVNIMQPWLVATSMAIPACELAAKQSAKPVLDGLIAKKAQETEKNLIGLETVKEQFSAMYDLPEAFHIKTLKETLRLGNVSEDVMETMKQLYLKGDVATIIPLTKIVTPNSSNGDAFKEFEDNLINNRNIIMRDRALPYFAKGNVFMAVGALHLPGDKGLVNLLMQAGYTLSPID